MSQYGEPWSYVEDGREMAILSSEPLREICCVAVDRGSDEEDHAASRSAIRIVAAVNACAGLNPAGIPKLIAAVTKIVQACHEARAQGWEDHTNFTQTLEVALEACYDNKPQTGS